MSWFLLTLVAAAILTGSILFARSRPPRVPLARPPETPLDVWEALTPAQQEAEWARIAASLNI